MHNIMAPYGILRQLLVSICESFDLGLVANTFSSAIRLHDLHQHQHPKRSVPADRIEVASHDFLCKVLSDLFVVRVRYLELVEEIDSTLIFTYGTTMSSEGAFYIVSDIGSIGASEPCPFISTQCTPDGAHPTDMISPNAA